MDDIKNVTEEEIRAIRKAYREDYYSRPGNKDKRKIYNQRYWAKKAAAAKNISQE